MKVEAIKYDNNHQKFSIWGTLSWMFFLSIGVQLGVGIIFGVIIRAFGVEATDIDLAFLRPSIMLLMVIVTLIISIPLIRKAALSPDKDFPFFFVAIRPIKQSTLVKVSIVGFSYYCLLWLCMELIGIETPQYMLDVKSQVNSILDLILLIISICLITPVIEEIIFRGLIFSRFQLSKLGRVGAVCITSIFFSVIHFQYEPIIIVFVFTMGLLLGVVRYKTDNVIYCIILHVIFNSLSAYELFFYFKS
jgi:membrane protease YdiL (CAAX protease family)